MDNTRAARAAARRQGHNLSRFAVSGDGLLTATCKGCGKTLTVRAKPVDGQHRFFGPARMACATAKAQAVVPVFVTNQVQPVAPAPVASFPQGEPLVKRVARAFALGFSALVASGSRQPVLQPVRQAA